MVNSTAAGGVVKALFDGSLLQPTAAYLQQHWTKIVALAGVLLLAAGMIAGHFIGRQNRTGSETGVNPAGSSSSSSSGRSSSAPGSVRGNALLTNEQVLKQLPPPDSEEAKQLLSQPDTPADIVAIYTYDQDAVLITERLSATFLKELLQQLATGSSNAQLQTLDIQPFVRVARDVLSYLRYSNSQALLPLLRHYSSSGTFDVTVIDPDVLQEEVLDLVNVTRLGEWYRAASQYDVAGSRTVPPPLVAAAEAAGSQVTGAAAAATGRRLLLSSQQQQRQRRQRQRHVRQRSRHFRRLHNAASIPYIPDDPSASAAAAASPFAAIPTASPEMSLQEMLCAIKPYSPTGLQGIKLPAGNSSSSSGAIPCKPPELGLFQHGNVVFQPVEVPVVFHLQRFNSNNVLQPPVWQPEKAGQRLIDVTNRFYKGSGIQFKLQEVRYDVTRDNYLLLATQEDWQLCSANSKESNAGFPCLTATSQFPSVTALTSKHVINVFVSGSNDPTAGFCNPGQASICRLIWLGYSRALGPWFSEPSETWKEGKSDENWVFINWDLFNPSGKNSERFWHGGAAALAHELGHYLGLMHTHEGASPCDGDGITKADAVPDTPVNKETNSFADDKGLLPRLSGWCSDFRNGKSPNPAEILPFNSCEVPGRVDNIWNVMSYAPDACCMMFTPNQIARLQWAIASFRPKLMQAHKV